jgi:hypothetical protein
MSNKFAKGFYQIKNPEKYAGNGKPIYRSSWEYTFMKFCDENKSILSWASEPIRIPYRHPLTGKNTTYVPDFLIVYEQVDGTKKAEIIEIKPRKQSLIEGKMNDRDRAIVAVNHAKWAAATKFCQANHLLFRVVNEHDIYHQGRQKKR